MLRKFRPLLAIAVAATAVAGCGMMEKINPLAASVHLYNNSGRTILVDDEEVGPRERTSMAYPEGSRKRVFIFSSGCVLSYTDLPDPPGINSAIWSSARAQLESDGRIFLLPSGAEFPLDVKNVQQPPGFPLIPLRGSGCEPSGALMPAVPATPAAASTPASSATK